MVTIQLIDERTLKSFKIKPFWKGNQVSKMILIMTNENCSFNVELNLVGDKKDGSMGPGLNDCFVESQKIVEP
jgi:hypothetical protein